MEIFRVAQSCKMHILAQPQFPITDFIPMLSDRNKRDVPILVPAKYTISTFGRLSPTVNSWSFDQIVTILGWKYHARVLEMRTNVHVIAKFIIRYRIDTIQARLYVQ